MEQIQQAPLSFDPPPNDTCSCGLSVFADPGLGSYDENGQYSCSEHCLEQFDDPDADCLNPPVALEEHSSVCYNNKQADGEIPSADIGQMSTFLEKEDTEIMATIAELKAERAQAKAKVEEARKRQMLLTIKDGDVARLRFTRDFANPLYASKHDQFNQTSPQESIRALCAVDFGKVCYWCNIAKRTKNKKLAPTNLVVLPCWLHDVTNPNASEEEQEYYDEMKGFRILLLNRNSDLVGTLLEVFDDQGSIMGCDFRYSRTGSGIQTRYALTPRAPSPFTQKSVSLDDEDIMALLAEALPYRTTGEEEGVPF